MTREKASILLMQIFNTYSDVITANYKDGVVRDAFVMAIEALRDDTPKADGKE